jgi:DNA-directed RNA polymerase subunit RPC12/RpoP
MLYSLSKQISHCYFRAGECRERAARCVSPADRQFYIEREQSWLTLARSYEFQERISRMIKELKRYELRDDFPPEQSLRTKPPQCPTCGVQMLFQARRPVKRMFVQDILSFERALFVCTNCQRLGEQLVVMPRDRVR